MTADFNPRAPCGARRILCGRMPTLWNFNPRAPCGARLGHQYLFLQIFKISTHAPLAGRDLRRLRARLTALDISTHAPLAGRDRKRLLKSCLGRNFNPRAPCGARRERQRTRRTAANISTHAPLAGRDRDGQSLTDAMRISTHAPLAGRDRSSLRSRTRWRNFNPRAPCGARRARKHPR